jgi:SanA protein
MPWRKLLRQLFISSMIILGLFSWLAWWSNEQVKESGESMIFTNTESMPKSKVGLLLGTSKYTKGGRRNLFFAHRIEAAAELHRTGKVDYLLVSGDNRKAEYNEPKEMRLALITAGVPDSAIVSDYAGFRTFDSVVRAKEVFGQSSFTIISQQFHLERALFIAKQSEIPAIGYQAQGVPAGYAIKTEIREYFARIKAILDVFILSTSPKFLGDPVKIGS